MSHVSPRSPRSVPRRITTIDTPDITRIACTVPRDTLDVGARESDIVQLAFAHRMQCSQC
jgi:hypothetical protein